ncbi:MAG: glycosyltransferase family 39 protein [Prevotella sp.]|nr:glycosyltransferase family 39 protein [Prevotella sp.]
MKRPIVPTLSEGCFLTLFILLSLFYHFLVGIQGFDMYDEGWSLTGFQQIFNAPDSVEYLFLYYLTNIFGGVWEQLFGFGGIYSFRILTGIILTLTAVIVWLMLRPYFNRWCILLGTLASFLCCYYGIMVFYHNYLTALITTAAAYTLFLSITRTDYRWMMVSGFLIGCNIFVRLPNITQTALILLLIPYYIYMRKIHQTLKLLCCGIGGFILGILSVVAFMLIAGHFDIFVTAISSGLSAASDSDSTHNLAEMSARYLFVYRIIFTQGIFSNVYSAYLLGTCACLWVLLFRRKNAHLVYLACITLCIMHLLPVGSDAGVQNMGENCIYLSVPFTVGIIWHELSLFPLHHRVRTTMQLLFVCFGILFYVRGGYNIMKQCYFDEGSRMEKTFLPEASLATTYTTEQNCQQLNTILRELQRYVKPDDTLLCFQNTPSLHYLTKTRPYLGNPWVWSFTPHVMEQKFIEAENSGRPLPVIVREKSMIPYWTRYYSNWNNDHALEDYFHKNKKITLINQFIHRHNYRVVWEDEVFQLLTTNH